jgi:hypothetical protein
MCDTCNVPLNVAEPARTDQKRAEIRRLTVRREVCTDSLRASVCWRRCDMAIPA